ncbi:MAG: hypothetical protein AAFR35_03915 [Pseudomonadota bacterium]
MTPVLIWIGRRGPFFLVAGLVVGLLSPTASEFVRPWVGALIALLLVVTGARVGAAKVFGRPGDLGPVLRRIGVLQVICPIAAFAVFAGMGALHHPMALAIVLMLAAPSVTGAPNFAIMIGALPDAGMRLLVIGTALFPATALLIFLLADPGGSGPMGALTQSLGLLAVILVSVGLGLVIRQNVPGLGDTLPQRTLDGIAALLLAVVVVGLMSAIGPLLRDNPLTLVGWLMAACGINFGLVLLTYAVCLRFGLDDPISTAIYAGNRNIALFLVVLPEEFAAPMMIFVGCYQIPMYLTPVLFMGIRR